MDDVLRIFLTEMIGRTDGPMRFRVLLQPLIAFLCGPFNRLCSRWAARAR
jgi:hypothetical protein